MQIAAGVPRSVALLLAALIVGCSIYVNLSFTVSDPADYRFFPPFQPHADANNNQHLGGEYYSIAKALAAGEGFAHPFDRPTGPTAWQPPVLPLILAGLHLVDGGDRNSVMAVVLLFQACALVGTGLLVIALTMQTTRIRAGWAAFAFLSGLLCNFNWCFQWTHDAWLLMPAIDLVIVGICWWQPLDRWMTAAGWGCFGGLCALMNPIVGFTWFGLTVVRGARERAWSKLVVAVLAAAFTVAPWAIRNYLVFGRWVPLKSNLAYEAYQTQCLQTGGLLEGATFQHHPFHAKQSERKEYEALGEMAYMDRKRDQFWQSVAADPDDFVERVGTRLAGATVWYVPFYRESETRRPVSTWFCRVMHPLPFVALLVLLVTSFWRPLPAAAWAAIGVYLLYLLPYIGVSYYERYALPLLGVKVLLVLWAVDRLLSNSLRLSK
jgi:hypothetical protein